MTDSSTDTDSDESISKEKNYFVSRDIFLLRIFILLTCIKVLLVPT